jgi:hypothetical protein
MWKEVAVVLICSSHVYICLKDEGKQGNVTVKMADLRTQDLPNTKQIYISFAANLVGKSTITYNRSINIPTCTKDTKAYGCTKSLFFRSYI